MTVEQIIEEAKAGRHHTWDIRYILTLAAEIERLRAKIKTVADAITPWMIANSVLGVLATDAVALVVKENAALRARLGEAENVVWCAENGPCRHSSDHTSDTCPICKALTAYAASKEKRA